MKCTRPPSSTKGVRKATRRPGRWEMQNDECRMQNAELKRMPSGDEKFHLRRRTKQFALRVIKLSSSLPDDYETLVIRKQVVRSGTSVGAQYREACRARSPAEF